MLDHSIWHYWPHQEPSRLHQDTPILQRSNLENISIWTPNSKVPKPITIYMTPRILHQEPSRLHQDDPCPPEIHPGEHLWMKSNYENSKAYHYLHYLRDSLEVILVSLTPSGTLRSSSRWPQNAQEGSQLRWRGRLYESIAPQPQGLQTCVIAYFVAEAMLYDFWEGQFSLEALLDPLNWP